MKIHRVALFAFTLTSVAALASANAADMYPAPAGGGYKDTPYVGVNWSGLYVGVNGGYGWNAKHSDDLVDPTGGFGGGQIGYNWQGMWHPNLVLGIEADLQGAGISDSLTGSGLVGPATVKSELEWFGTVRGRLGYAFGSALLYGTGGFAYGSVKNSLSTVLGSISQSETQTGWVAGGGIEYKIAPAWSAKAEYQFLSLDASDPNGPGPLGANIGNNDRSEVHTFRVGVNYFVGRGYEPLK
jgi:outer membrane immunogenic protein